MPKKKTAIKRARNKPGARTQNKASGAPIFFYYKGARYELKIVNSVIRRFRKLAGDVEDDVELSEDEATGRMYYLLMAVLKLHGNWEEHEDSFESLVTLAPKFAQAMERFKSGGNVPGEPVGGNVSPSRRSDTV